MSNQTNARDGDIDIKWGEDLEGGTRSSQNFMGFQKEGEFYQATKHVKEWTWDVRTNEQYALISGYRIEVLMRKCKTRGGE